MQQNPLALQQVQQFSGNLVSQLKQGGNFGAMARQFSQNASAADTVLVPKIEGDWWQVAGSPDLGQYTTERQQPVDFAIWQAADGSWQIWSCIRATSYPGWTRLLYRWESKSLTDHDWKPMGIVMTSDTGLAGRNRPLEEVG